MSQSHGAGERAKGSGFDNYLYSMSRAEQSIQIISEKVLHLS